MMNVEVALYGESRGGECGFKDFREKTLQNVHSEDDIVEFWDNVRSLKSFLRLTTKMPYLPWVPDLDRLAETKSYLSELGMKDLLNESLYRAA
jgi:hypothetical protein